MHNSSSSFQHFFESRERKVEISNGLVIFDLDGTLVDPLFGIANAYRFMCRKLNLPLLSDSDVARLIGPSLAQALNTQFGLEGNDMDRAIETYRMYYSKRGLYETSPRKGVVDIVQEVIRVGSRSCIATNKPELFAKRIVRNFNWTPYFSEIAGASLDVTAHRKSEIIRTVINRLDFPVDRCLMVGDRVEDADGASEVGIPFIGVSWGYGKVDELMGAGALRVVNTNGELIDEIRHILLSLSDSS